MSANCASADTGSVVANNASTVGRDSLIPSNMSETVRTLLSSSSRSAFSITRGFSMGNTSSRGSRLRQLCALNCFRRLRACTSESIDRSRHLKIFAIAEAGTSTRLQFNKQFPPIVAVRSEIDAFIAFELIELVEIFQEKVLTPITDLCAEHRLFLDDDY